MAHLLLFSTNIGIKKQMNIKNKNKKDKKINYRITLSSQHRTSNQEVICLFSCSTLPNA